MNNTLDDLYALLGAVVLLPIPFGKKGPSVKGWQNTTFADTQTPAYQQRLAECVTRGGNIGILLGPASADLHAIDIDDGDLAETFLAYNPILANTLRSRGRRGCQFWTRPKPGTKFPNGKAVYPLKTAKGDDCGEWRCGGPGGAQSVIFGRHPEGSDYQVMVDRPPLEIDLDQIKWLGPAPGITEDPQEDGREPELLGKSLIYYADRQIDNSKNLLGNRWLSRCCGALVIAPSGHGKSSLAVQFTILVSCGRTAFGIHPPKPLRVLIIQAEDDDNDLTEMAAMVRWLDLTPVERDAVSNNTHCLWINDVTGLPFTDLADKALEAFPADLLLINPLSAYVGKDLKDEESVHEFFRVWLTPVLKKRNCGMLGIHHTPKTNFRNTESFNWYDWMYSGAGHAGLNELGSGRTGYFADGHTLVLIASLQQNDSRKAAGNHASIGTAIQSKTA